MATQRQSTIESRTALYEDAVDLVRREYSERLELDDVARRLASSRRQLQRAFHEAGQTSFRWLVIKTRISRAAQLLRDSDLPVGQIAERVGYRQPAQFSKAFRRYTGLAPSQFRRNGKAKQAQTKASTSSDVKVAT